MRTLTMLALILLLGGCGASPAASPSTTVASLPESTATPTSTALPTQTPVPTATSTTMPTNTPTSTSTATTEPTATSTSTATPMPVDVSAWRVPVITAGVTVAVINALEETALRLQDGTLSSIDAGGRLLGYRVVVVAIAQNLDEMQLENAQAEYLQDMKDNLAGVFGVIDRWQGGDVSSATVASELTPVRAASEQTLSEIMRELRRLGVSQAQIEEFLAEVNAAMEP